MAHPECVVHMTQLSRPLPQGKAPPCSTQGPGPPFPGSETDSNTDRGRKHQFAQADQATCIGGRGSKSAKIYSAVDYTDSSAQADHSRGHQLLKSGVFRLQLSRAATSFRISGIPSQKFSVLHTKLLKFVGLKFMHNSTEFLSLNCKTRPEGLKFHSGATQFMK